MRSAYPADMMEATEATAFLLSTALQRGKVSSAVAAAFADCFSMAVHFISISVVHAGLTVSTENLMRPCVKRSLRLLQFPAEHSLAALCLAAGSLVTASTSDPGPHPADMEHAQQAEEVRQFMSLPLSGTTSGGDVLSGALTVGSCNLLFSAEDPIALASLTGCFQPLFSSSVGRLLDHVLDVRRQLVPLDSLVRLPSSAHQMHSAVLRTARMDRQSSSAASSRPASASSAKQVHLAPAQSAAECHMAQQQSIDIFAGIDLGPMYSQPRPSLSSNLARASLGCAFGEAQQESVEVTDVSMTAVTSDASMVAMHSASCASDQTHVCGAVAQMAADAPGMSEAHSPNNSNQRWAVS